VPRELRFEYKEIGNGLYRPVIPIELTLNETIRYEALVDSGADYCVFDTEMAEALGIEDIATGEQVELYGMDETTFYGYRHSVTVKIDGAASYEAPIIFTEQDMQDEYGIIGQQGLFDHFTVTLDYASKIIVLHTEE
jgi:hypothetical protein